ncbi:histidine phosphotransferase family protein [Roseovarius sp. SYSU LYC5161]|uniref:histidine phosphotransferase family protein n=1 Tax=Roseovarius halophilus (ex Wu et al. 2025) TaxID=3376060 RepID=UPI0028726620|nr:histidine phosphotransferase family protein [Roseovarius sp.]
MASYDDDLATLIGSRICHDLISPVGAVANGMELIRLGGMPDSPEMALVDESAANAGALIRLFRLAFGTPDAQQHVSSDTMASILRDVYRGGRTEVCWRATGDFPRSTAQLVMLGTLCVDRALAYGGRLEIIGHGADHWTIAARADRLSFESAPWHLISGDDAAQELSPTDVQFALLPRLLARKGRSGRHRTTENALVLEF